MTKFTKYAAPVGRIFISLIFLLSGLNKISAYEGTQGYMEAMGIPGGLLPFTIIFEVGFSLAVIVGWQTRFAALALAGFSFITAFLFHADFGDQIQSIMFMKNIAISGGFLFLVAQGAGVWSVDSLLAGRANLAGK
ncbi:MAG TPA: DoxX family protein [Sphingomonadales bacterium]|nr:DoxX family protein [Sphingomonadales bacterium]